MDFTLDVVNPEEVKEKVEQELAVPATIDPAIQKAAEEKALQIMAVDLDSYDNRKEFTGAIDTFGQDVVQKAEVKNNILAKRMVELSKNGAESGEVAKGLEELAMHMKDLDPSGIDFAKKSRFFNPVRKYFERYKTADAQIADIVKSLEKGKSTLINDNTTLELEEASMRDITKQLNQKIEMGTALDNYLSNALAQKKIEGGDEEKVRFIEEEVLFPLRQRIMDFQQLQVVNQQGVVAMDVIRSNNKELIRAVDRAETVTVSSLRTAVTVAGALYNQKIVLEKVQYLNESTNTMIKATAKMLKDQGVEIQQQATEANISVDTLKQSFADTLSALDDISNYKQEALPKIAKTIAEFRELAETGEKRLQEMEKRGNFLDLTADEKKAIEGK
ncbi:MAG: toxic anion resistance protein [Oscillospiraceae bacterium]|nr:toxic anion resistance protein [Oscillospiraceae bacterium]